MKITNDPSYLFKCHTIITIRKDHCHIPELKALIMAVNHSTSKTYLTITPLKKSALVYPLHLELTIVTNHHCHQCLGLSSFLSTSCRMKTFLPSLSQNFFGLCFSQYSHVSLSNSFAL